MYQQEKEKNIIFWKVAFLNMTDGPEKISVVSKFESVAYRKQENHFSSARHLKREERKKCNSHWDKMTLHCPSFTKWIFSQWQRDFFFLFDMWLDLRLSADKVLCYLNKESETPADKNMLF